MSNHPFDYQAVKSLSEEQVCGLLADRLNTFTTFNIKKFTEALNCQHRTLQQGLIGVLIKVLVEYGRTHQKEFSYDARNEDSVVLCRKLASLVDQEVISEYTRFI